jgi:hypothetical protein
MYLYLSYVFVTSPTVVRETRTVQIVKNVVEMVAEENNAEIQNFLMINENVG